VDSGPRVPLEKATWTDADFGVMGWHDAALHALAIEPSPPYPGRLLVDIDYIVEWIAPSPSETTFSFWLCPATLVFDQASDLVFEGNLIRHAFEPALDAVKRSEPDGDRCSPSVVRARTDEFVRPERS
jgi:hypothetical protein